MTQTRTDVSRILTLSEKGLSDSDISRLCEVPIPTVRNVRLRNSVPAVKQYRRRGPAIDEALALKLYKEGLSDREIAGKVFCERMTICMFRNRYGLPPNTPPRKELDKALVLRLWREGLNDVEAAKQIGCAAGTIARFRRKNGLPPNRPAKLDNERVLELYQAGLTDAEIASKTGFSATTITKWRRKNGFPLNKHSEFKSVKREWILAIERKIKEVKASGEADSDYGIGVVVGLRYAKSVLREQGNGKTS